MNEKKPKLRFKYNLGMKQVNLHKKIEQLSFSAIENRVTVQNVFDKRNKLASK